MVIKMGLQYMYQISQLGAAEPRFLQNPLRKLRGKTMSVPPAASLGMAMTQCV